MLLSRRSLLKALAMLTLGTAAGTVAVQRWGDRVFTPLHRLRQAQKDAVLPTAPTGTLAAPTLQSLLAVTETLAATALALDHYERYFQWRAANLPGYNALYEQFVTALNRLAQQRARIAFVDCDVAVRRQLLAKVFTVRARSRGQFGRLQSALFDREWLLFDQFIVREIFQLFVKTSAWVVLGYESWPGTPRGLEHYRQAPQG